MKIFVLPLWQPWASLFALGIKKNETRPKRSPYQINDIILIHAAKKHDKEIAGYLASEPYLSLLVNNGLYVGNMPFGQIIGGFIYDGQMETYQATQRITDQERELGDYSYGRWCWIGSDHFQLKNPIDYKAQQGYFNKYDIDPQTIIILSDTGEEMTIGEFHESHTL